MSRRAIVSTTVLVGVLAAAAGLGAGLVLAPVPVPDAVAPVVDAQVVTVTARDFDDLRSVEVSPVLEKSRDYTSQAAGVVRASSCKPGEMVASGQRVLTVDDRSVIALHLSTPPWRSLSRGMHGDDVKALQRELVRLGYQVATDGRYAAQTEREVEALWKKAGTTSRLKSLPLDQLVWLPGTSAVPASCPLAVGDRLTAGGKVFTTGGRLTGLRLTVPTTAQQGERVAELGKVQAPVSGKDVVDDAAFLTAFAATRDYQAWAEAKASDKTASQPLTVQTRLAMKISVVPIPPAALYAVNGTTACLVDGGKPIQVRVVASELGQTYVAASPLPTAVSVPAPDGASPCA